MENNEKTANDESKQVALPFEDKACPGKCTNKQMARREALLQAKNSLIETMIYHIRTLSNAVIGFSDLLMDEPLSEDGKEFIHEIHRAGQGLSVLTKEVLDCTQLLGGELKITKIKFSLSDVLYEIKKILSCATSQKGLDYEIVVDPDIPAYLNTDQDRLIKCLVNLTASAIKYTSQGSVRLHVNSECCHDELFIRFDIIDTGAGISPEKMETVFDAAKYRIEADEQILSQLEQGLIVTTGLPLTRQLCQLLGGTIEAKSSVNQGSTFSLRVPAGVNPADEPKLGLLSWPNEDVSQACEELQEATTSDSRESANILLVEDQQSNRTVITLMLESLGIKVQTAEDGIAALSLCDQQAYDLVLMDLKMPNMDGYEATRQLRQKGFKMPIVALSATVTCESERHQISELFDGFLTKPVSSEKLGPALEQFLENVTADSKNAPSHSGNQGVREHEMGVMDHENQTK